MILKIRKGTENELKQIELEEGEIVFTTDTKRIYIGLGEGEKKEIGGGV